MSGEKNTVRNSSQCTKIDRIECEMWFSHTHKHTHRSERNEARQAYVLEMTESSKQKNLFQNQLIYKIYYMSWIYDTSLRAHIVNVWSVCRWKSMIYLAYTTIIKYNNQLYNEWHIYDKHLTEWTRVSTILRGWAVVQQQLAAKTK